MFGAVHCTGFPPNQDAFPRSLATAQKIGQKVRALRMFGTAAISYAWVSCGRLTSYTAYDVNAWDFSAGMLLVSEAGGRNTNGVDGAPLKLSDRDTICSNGAIHDELLGEIL